MPPRLRCATLSGSLMSKLPRDPNESADATSVGEGPSSTTPEDIPPVHVLEAADAQDRRETENLLAGFDRPNRASKRRADRRDFVDHYSGKHKSSRPPSGEMRPSAAIRESGRSTFVLQKPKRTPLAHWAVVAAVMLSLGGVVAFVATSEHSSGSAVPPIAPLATTTIRSAPLPTVDVPPPDPPSDTVAPTPTVIAIPQPRSEGSKTTASGEGLPSTSASAKRPPPRDDFIRDF